MATGVDRKLCVSMSSLASHAPHPGDLEQIELFAEQLELIMELLQVDTIDDAREINKRQRCLVKGQLLDGETVGHPQRDAGE